MYISGKILSKIILYFRNTRLKEEDSESMKKIYTNLCFEVISILLIPVHFTQIDALSFTLL